MLNLAITLYIIKYINQNFYLHIFYINPYLQDWNSPESSPSFEQGSSKKENEDLSWLIDIGT